MSLPAVMPGMSCTAAQVGEEEQAGDSGEPARGVEDPVGDQAGGQGGLVAEVMPVQQLMEHGLVDERADTHPE
jgi:hypothetical protein